MNYLITYDVTDNKKRKKIADFLLEKGFRRIQKSVFLGNIKLNTYKNICFHLNKLLDKKVDRIFYTSVPEDEYNKAVEAEQIEKDIYNHFVLFV